MKLYQDMTDHINDALKAIDRWEQDRDTLQALDERQPTWPMMLILGGWRFVKWSVKRLAVLAVVAASCLVIAYALGWLG